ncbi:MAG: thioesterase family protein [Bacteroidota bacterium]
MIINPGIKFSCEKIVTKADTANSYGSGLVEVFATPAMIALMEKTCMESVKEIIPEDYTTVGTQVNINHIKPTFVGMKVICESELIETDNKKLLFKVIAFDNQGEIGNGFHTRVVVNKEKFISKQ